MTDEQIRQMIREGKYNDYSNTTARLKRSKERTFNGFKGEYTKPKYKYTVAIKASPTLIRRVNEIYEQEFKDMV